MHGTKALQPVPEPGIPARRGGFGAALGAVLVLALLVALSAAALVVAPSEPGGRPAASPSSVTVPDTLLLASPATAGGQGVESSTSLNISAYLPGLNAIRPLLEGAGEPVISADGRQLFFTQVDRTARDTVRAWLTAFAADTLVQQWRVQIDQLPASAFDASTPGGLVWSLSAAVTDDRVYVAEHRSGTRDPVTVAVLDRSDGRERARWSIALDGAAAALSLYTSPDGQTLSLLAPTVNPQDHQAMAPELVRLRLPVGQLERHLALTDQNGAPVYFWSGRLAGDGHTLYDLAYTGNATGLAITFLDLQTGTVQPPLDFPFAGTGELAYEQGLSPDGRLLYVLAPTLKELAIVDLERRGILRTVPVDTGAVTAARPSLLARVGDALRGLFVRSAAAKFYVLGTMQLSPDGKLMYAVGVKGDEAIPNGVWVINTATWQVVAHWLTSTTPSQILLAAGGQLYVQTYEQAGGTLRVLDATTGAEVFTMPAQSAYLLPALYQERYGRSPGGSEVAAAQASDLTPFASLTASVSPKSILSGDRVTVEARFVDPRSGATVVPGPGNLRYDTPDRVIATFSRGSSRDDDVTATLAPVGYGVFRGTAALTGYGAWDLVVNAERANAPGSRATVQGAITVQPAFTGTDGRRYVLTLTTDPPKPVVNQPAAIRAAFVDARTGAPLPDGVTLQGGLPATLDAAFFGVGMQSVTLRPTGHGVYTGTRALWAAGNWTARAGFTVGGTRYDIVAGTVDVTAP